MYISLRSYNNSKSFTQCVSQSFICETRHPGPMGQRSRKHHGIYENHCLEHSGQTNHYKLCNKQTCYTQVEYFHIVCEEPKVQMHILRSFSIGLISLAIARLINYIMKMKETMQNPQKQVPMFDRNLSDSVAIELKSEEK